jgi:hypothetical protein
MTNSKPFHSVLASKECFDGKVSKSFSREGIKAMKLDPKSNTILAVQLGDGKCGSFDLISLKSHYAPFFPGTDQPVRNSNDFDAPAVSRGKSSLSFLPETPWVAMSADYGIRLFDFKTRNKCLVKTKLAADCVACHPQGEMIAYSMTDKSYGIFGFKS